MALTVSLDEIIAAGHPLLAIKPHWTRIRLGEIGRVLNGFAFKSALFSRDRGMPLVRIRDVGKNASDTFYSGEFDGRYVVEAGDLLVGMDGDFNCARWRGPKSLLNQRVCKISIDSGMYLPRFLDYVLPSYLKAINEATSSITVKHLSSRTVEDIPLPLPPLNEQRAIVEEIEKQFSRLDEAVANLQRVKAKLEDLESRILRDAARGALHCNPPANWPIFSVNEAGHVLLGRQRAPQYLTGEWSRKYLRVANIKDDRIDFSDLLEMDFDQAHFPKYQISPGDILVSEGQSPELLGQSAIFRGYEEPLCFQKTLHRFRANPDKTTPEFAQIVFRAHVRSGVFRRLGSITTNIGHLTLEKFRAAPFPLPPLIEQAAVVAEVDRRLSIVREVEAEVDANLKRAQSLRQAILAKAFAGAPA